MCGISGYINLDINVDRSGILQKMANMQNHRGPDHTGFYEDDYLGIAHNRLSLLDLSVNGNQPFVDDQYVLAYNGEIYNFIEIKNLLDPVIYKSSSDTEVLFEALKQWGVKKTLEKIQGMFAFIWYEKRTKKIWLCRDRYGIKPLFYGRSDDGTFWFASEQKAILGVGNYKPDSISMLFSTLGIIEKSNHKTVWDNIYILPAGSYLEFDGNKYKLKEYYSIIDDVDINEYKRLDKTSWRDVCEEFDTLLNDAVRKMLISDAPMGAYVSGGVDSSLISSYAIKYNNPFKLFTANVLGRHSEYKDAVTLASHLKQELVPYDFHKEFAFRDWAKVCWHYESPIAVHFNAIPFSNVSKLAHEHSIKAVLTGEGADELFLGYPRLLTRKFNKLVKFPFTVINSIYNQIPGLKQYLNPDFGNMGLLSLFELGVQGFRRQIVRENQIDSYYFLPEKSRLQHYVTAQMMQEGIRSLLWRNDRMGMIYSIESRFPFLDENIVRFAMNLPIKFKIGRSSRFHNYKHPFLIDKAIVRKTASTYLPKKLVYKKKNGFPTNGLRDIKIRPKFFYDSTTTDLLKLNNKQVDYMCQTVPKYHLSLLGSFEIWAKLFVQNYSMDKVTDQINIDFSFD